MRWRCRRGLKELDLLLGGWMERRWSQADAGERACFARLLELPDPELAACLLGGAPHPDARLAALVDEILRASH